MKTSGLGTAPRKLLEEMKEIEFLGVLSCKGQDHQAQGRGHRLTTAQGLAITDENRPPQQTTDDQ
jgi:hypothetical protein